MGNNGNNNRKLISPSIRYRVMKRDNFACVICGKKREDGVKLEVDHIVPVVEGGTNKYDNLRTLCFDCNRGRVVDIDYQTILDTKDNVKTYEERHKEREEIEEETKNMLKNMGYDDKTIEKMLTPQSMIFYRHSLWTQIKWFFHKPDLWGVKKVWDEEANEWIEEAWGVAFHKMTWRELIEQKVRYKKQEIIHRIYSFLCVIPRKSQLGGDDE